MLHPSYKELMETINKNSEPDEPLARSRYTVVMATAKRARQLMDAGYMDSPDHAKKPLSIAVDELDEGKIRVLTEEEDREMALRHEQELSEREARRQEEKQKADRSAEELFDRIAEEAGEAHEEWSEGAAAGPEAEGSDAEQPEAPEEAGVPEEL